MTIPKEFQFAFSKIKDQKKIYLGALAALAASVIVSFIPYIYGRLVDIAISSEELMKNIEGIYRNFWELQTAIQRIHD